MTGEPTHTASKERNGATCLSYINYCLKIEVSIALHSQLYMFNPLHNITNQELFEEHLCNLCIPHQMKEMALRIHINYCLKSEVSITLRCWLFSILYTAVRIKNCLKSTPAI